MRGKRGARKRDSCFRMFFDLASASVLSALGRGMSSRYHITELCCIKADLKWNKESCCFGLFCIDQSCIWKVV